MTTPETSKEKEHPHWGQRLTREGVLRLIQENGGTAQGLDLAGAILRDIGPDGIERGIDLTTIHYLDGISLQEADLRNANLCKVSLEHANIKGAILVETDLNNADVQSADLENAYLQNSKLSGAHLSRANLSGAKLWDAELQGAFANEANLQQASLLNANLHGAHLWRADLRNASLCEANLQAARLDDANFNEADLEGADLRGAYLKNARLFYANLHNIEWGDYILGEEREGNLEDAMQTYRSLKAYHTQAGMGNVAGHFFYREMESERKLVESRLKTRPAPNKWSWWGDDLGRWIWLCITYLVAGYGEKPERVFLWALAVVLYFSALYMNYGLIASDFGDALYFSAVSFTALGYGKWAPEPQGWGRFLGAFEAMLGVSTLALLLTLFVRKMTR